MNALWISDNLNIFLYTVTIAIHYLREKCYKTAFVCVISHVNFIYMAQNHTFKVKVPQKTLLWGKMEETSGRATEEGSLFQDRHAKDVCTGKTRIKILTSLVV